MRYEEPKMEMELIVLKEDILTMSLQPGDITEGSGLPEIDMGEGAD